MRILIYFLFFIISYTFAYADIDQSNEILDISWWIYSNTSYVSNKEKNYYFIWSVQFYNLNSQDELNSLVDSLNLSDDDFLILKNESNYSLLIKEENYLDYGSHCIWISSDQNKLFSIYEDSILIEDFKDKVFWQLDSGYECYYYEDKLYLAKNSFSHYDMDYFIDNTNFIKDNLNNISKNKDTLRDIYVHITENTDYNYDILDELPNLPDDMYPWRVASFFEWDNLICDGYVKSFLFYSRYYWIEWSRVVWEIQPILQTDVRLEWYLHSWVEIDWLYYDPTFDDTDLWNNFDYFWKSQTCFNVNHYKEDSDWVLFESIEDRFRYVKDNSYYLLDNCGWILFSSISNDGKFIEFLNYSINTHKELSLLSDFLCEYMDICDVNYSSKENFKESLSNYRIQLEVDWVINEYNIADYIDLDKNWNADFDKNLDNNLDIDIEEKEVLENEEPDMLDTNSNDYSDDKFDLLNSNDKDRIYEVFLIISDIDDWTYQQQVKYFYKENKYSFSARQEQIMKYLLNLF